jgi:1-acyl-sn-glycerol-3-phosphate acyltransferase
MPQTDSFYWLTACIWLAFLAVVVLAYVVQQYRRSPYTLWESVLYAPTYLWGRLLWRVHFANRPPAEMASGAVLVANHRSSVDPFFVQLAAGRRVHWMVAREYCENAVIGPLLKALQVIPTNRSGMDTGATKQAIRLAKEGRLVGMFPEGRLNHTANDPLVSIRPGAALVAMRAGVPMIPLYILGSPYRREVWSPVTMPARVRITFGQPIDPQRFPAQNAPSAAGQTREAAELDPSSEDDRTPEAAAVAEPANGNGDESQRQVELAFAEHMMLEWGRQIVMLAGRPGWKLEIAGRSRLARAGQSNGVQSKKVRS